MAALEKRDCPGLDPTTKCRVDRAVARAISQALEQAGIRPSRKSRKVLDFVLGNLLMEGPGFQDWQATHVKLEEVKRRVRLYLVHSGARPKSERRSSGRPSASSSYWKASSTPASSGRMASRSTNSVRRDLRALSQVDPAGPLPGPVRPAAHPGNPPGRAPPDRRGRPLRPRQEGNPSPRARRASWSPTQRTRGPRLRSSTGRSAIAKQAPHQAHPGGE